MKDEQFGPVLEFKEAAPVAESKQSKGDFERKLLLTINDTPALLSLLYDLVRQRDELAAALAPFAACADIALRVGSISPAETFLWKATSTNKDMPGISLAHLLTAKAAIARYQPAEKGSK